MTTSWRPELEAEVTPDLRDILDAGAPEVVERADAAPARLEVRVDRLQLRITQRSLPLGLPHRVGNRELRGRSFRGDHEPVVDEALR